jgi:hypothetical protein
MTGPASISAFCATTDGLLFAASVEGAIILLVLWLLSALFNWIKRRAEEKQSGAPAPVPPPGRPGEHPAPATAPAPAAKSWEEELKRLLEGESPVFTPAPPPPPPPVAPPIIVAVPPPVLTPARTPARATANRRTAAVEPFSEESEAPSRPLATLRESEAAHRRTGSLERRTGERLQKAQALATAEAAYSSASQLHERVAARMRHVVDHTREAGSAPLETRRHHVAASATLALLQSPQSARQAIVTALVLAPPKAMEN